MASLASTALNNVVPLCSDARHLERRLPCTSCNAAGTPAINGTSSSQRLQGSAVSVRPLRKAYAGKAASTVAAAAETSNAAPVAEAPEAALVASEPDSLPPLASKDDADIPDPSSFMSDVSSLINLVDSRDIVELELKHKTYEITIRKAAALKSATPAVQQHVTFPGPHVMAHSGFPQQFMQAPPPPPAEAAPAPAAAPPPAAAPAPKAPSGLPPMLSPMAGTFYRSPAPGEAAFVKVGDRVQKGQVVCIVEAMKLMNEIEADQTGTIVDIVAKDGQGVAIETPLFLIQP
eukprot:TRINITY_DN6360_c0_g1_i1.p1 TRINITY_DN6360_c0_g1~~TRINITY_DN6360_c0_g1_i1.p1  ORF type:complete len:290 (+),score=63.13 TRINITY_DN6360_c0_g1_i1:236-1105(+)